MLVGAAYLEFASVLLTFDRAINAGALVAGDIVVSDGPSGARFVGFAVLGMPTDESVNIELVPDGSAPVTASITLDAPGGAGIVSLDGDEPWAGVEGLTLPFG